MIKLPTSSQTREADAYTISSKAISSLELMEAASLAFVKAFKVEIPDENETISIYCGTGNNGGDGLAIARLLKEEGYDRLSVKIVRFSANLTEDFKANFNRLHLTGIPIIELSQSKDLPEEEATVIIDALIGSGLNKPVEGKLKSLIEYLNALQRRIIAVDVPSGFPSEGIIDPATSILKANLAISFQRPKINFFFPESAKILDRFKVVQIGLDENFIQTLPGPWKLIEEKDIRRLIKPRKAFSHKGTYGHALIIAGSTETMGAALLCADACLHSGVGLTSVCIPKEGLCALNTRSPEIMALIRQDMFAVNQLDKYSSIAIGPGLGTDQKAIALVEQVMTYKKTPMVFDADALTILSLYPDPIAIRWEKLPEMAILTPHVKEFDRMFGEHSSWWERVETARIKAREFKLIILLKNQYSFIVLPDGDVLINPTGNPAMATGGMGDVLTGMIAAFLAQAYSPSEAVMLACYIHGKAGDELKEKDGMFIIPPRYIIKKIPEIINTYSHPEL